jgi:hypothetical protein
VWRLFASLHSRGSASEALQGRTGKQRARLRIQHTAAPHNSVEVCYLQFFTCWYRTIFISSAQLLIQDHIWVHLKEFEIFDHNCIALTRTFFFKFMVVPCVRNFTKIPMKKVINLNLLKVSSYGYFSLPKLVNSILFCLFYMKYLKGARLVSYVSYRNFLLSPKERRQF